MVTVGIVAKGVTGGRERRTGESPQGSCGRASAVAERRTGRARQGPAFRRASAGLPRRVRGRRAVRRPSAGRRRQGHHHVAGGRPEGARRDLAGPPRRGVRLHRRRAGAGPGRPRHPSAGVGQRLFRHSSQPDAFAGPGRVPALSARGHDPVHRRGGPRRARRPAGDQDRQGPPGDPSRRCGQGRSHRRRSGPGPRTRSSRSPGRLHRGLGHHHADGQPLDAVHRLRRPHPAHLGDAGAGLRTQGLHPHRLPDDPPGHRRRHCRGAFGPAGFGALDRRSAARRPGDHHPRD